MRVFLAIDRRFSIIDIIIEHNLSMVLVYYHLLLRYDFYQNFNGRRHLQNFEDIFLRSIINKMSYFCHTESILQIETFV